MAQVIGQFYTMDICSYCEIATESIQKSIERGNYDGALVQLSAYLLEIHSRFMNGEIDATAWRDTISFYRKMVHIVNDEMEIQTNVNLTYESEEK